MTNLGTGTLYIGLPGDADFAPLGEIAESELTLATEERDAFKVREIITNNTEEATFKLTLTKKQLEQFFEVMFHVRDQVLRICCNEGNARVCHLAKLGKKVRTRKKNVRRAYRILEKES